jgi:exosome complex component RRP41
MTTKKYTKRKDNRKFDEMRPIKAEVGVVKSADGSALFQIGDTIAIAVVRGPRELHPRFLQNPETGILRCNYDMASFSVPDRKRPGPSRRSSEISLVTGKALLPVLDLKKFPNTVVDIFIEIIQANAGTRCAGICAASMALAQAGLPMKSLVSAVSVGKVGDKVVVDLDKEEEDFEGGATDIPVAFTSSTGELTLLQLDGEITKKELVEAMKIGKKSCEKLSEIQKKALKDFFKGGKK